MALEEFEDGVHEVELLRELAVASERNAAPASNTMCRAAVVLLVSHFESFLKSIAEEFVDAVGTGEVTSVRLPSGLRETHTIPRLEEIVLSQDSTQRASLLRKLGDVTALWNDTAKPSRGTLKPRIFARLVTSASPNVIDALFQRMGAQEHACDGDLDIAIEDEVDTVNISVRVNEIVKCRNDIAHGDTERKPTPEDVARYTRFLSSFAGRLQRKATKLTTAVVGDQP
ncbi:MAG: MAE_28990/MAE_18760 family HEPN-like nuclease [Microbacterium sp.]